MTFSARSSEYGLSGLEKTDFHAGSKYKRGSNHRIDASIDRADAIKAFLKQRPEEFSQLTITQLQLVQLAQLQ